MIALDILLSACFAVSKTSEEDTLRTERLDEVVVTSVSARQRLQNVQTGAEVLQLEDLHRFLNCLARQISCVPYNYCQV